MASFCRSLSSFVLNLFNRNNSSINSRTQNVKEETNSSSLGTVQGSGDSLYRCGAAPSRQDSVLTQGGEANDSNTSSSREITGYQLDSMLVQMPQALNVTSANSSAGKPNPDVINEQKLLCILSPPCQCGLRVKSVTVKQVMVPLSKSKFLCRPALGFVEPNIQIGLSELEERASNCHQDRSYYSDSAKSAESCYQCDSTSDESLTEKSCNPCNQGSDDSVTTEPSNTGCSRKVKFVVPQSSPNVKIKRHAAVTKTINNKPSRSHNSSHEKLHLTRRASRSRKNQAQKVDGSKEMQHLKSILSSCTVPAERSLERNNSNSASKLASFQVDDIKWAGRVVRVLGDGRCLFRSLVAASDSSLQKCRRDEYGRPESSEDEERERQLADFLRAKVVDVMKENLHFYSQLENVLINADQPVSRRYNQFRDRLDAMSNNYTMPGELELNAASYVLERMVVVLNTEMEIISVFGDDRFPESTPLTVRFTRLGEDVGHYDAVLLEDVSSEDSGYFKKVAVQLKRRLMLLRRKIADVSSIDMDAEMETDKQNNHHDNESVHSEKPVTDCNDQKVKLDAQKNDQNMTLKSLGHSISACTQTSALRQPQRKRGRKKQTGSRRSSKRRAKPKRRVQERNYNRNNPGGRGRKRKSKSRDSDDSCERQRKNRKTNNSEKKSKTKSRPGDKRESKERKNQKRSSRKKVWKFVQVPSLYMLVDPGNRQENGSSEFDFNHPKPGPLPEALHGGQQRCYLCRKEVATNTGLSWLKCFICGRFAHLACAVNESPAWGESQLEDRYFLCSNCVPEY